MTTIYNKLNRGKFISNGIKFSDFKTNRTNYLRFDKATSISLSVYPSAEIEIFLSDDEKFDYRLLQLPNDRWTHITIMLHKNNVIQLKNNVIFRRTNDFKPTEIVFKSTNETYWKIHQCEYSTLVTINGDHFNRVNF
jgi:hypothetical protein